MSEGCSLRLLGIIMDYRSLLYFITIAKHGSFTKAAEELFISQSAISQSINHLEKALDVKLFNRGRVISLTRAGRVFLSEATRIYQNTVQLKEQLKELKNEAPEFLTIGISTFYSKYFLPKIVSYIEKNYPQLSVNFIEDSSMKMEEMLFSGILDCCLVPLPLGHAGLESIPVRMETIYIAAPQAHSLSKTPSEKPVSLKTFKNDRFILTKPVQRFTALAHSLCENAGFSPNIVYETMNWDTVNALVSEGIGVGFVPDILTSKANAKAAVYRKIDDPKATRFYVLARKKGKCFSEYSEKFLSELPSLFSSLIKDEFEGIV